ncbi:MAG: fibronectin type III domain-containing protein [Prevotella sp.]|nr:fibronectin type III domain-containing protein [Prevotella sp.]
MSEGSSLEGSISLNSDEDYKFVWKKGPYDEECGFVFYDENNKEILSHEMFSKFVFVDVEGYSTCLAKTDCPEDYSVGNVRYNSAELSWTGNGGAQTYNLRYRNLDADDGWHTLTGVTSSYTLANLAAETKYAWEVQAVYSDHNSDWVIGESFTTLERYVRPYDLAVTDVASTKAVLSWSGNEEVQSYNLRYREADFVLSENFENGMPSTWQTSGENVFVGNPPPGMTAPSGGYVLAISGGGTVTLPQMPLGGALTFQAGAYGSSTSGYYVKVIIDGDSVVVADGTVSEGSFAQQTVDLSAYTGQTGAISIVMTSGSYLIVDDVNILPADDAGWTTVNNAVAPYKLTGLTPETSYVVQAQAVYGEGKSKWETFPIITTLERYAKPYGLAVTDTAATSAVLLWSGNEEVQSYNLRYCEADFVLSESFENGMPSTWQKSGENVFVSPPPPGLTAPSGGYVFGINGGGNVTLPQMPLGGTLTFQAAAFNFSTAGYKVSVSTDEGDEIVAEGTANAGTFALQTVDLSAYAGQTGAIKITMTSGAYLIIDDVRISTGNVAGWTTVNNAVAPYMLKGLTPETYYEVQAQAVYEGKTTDWTESVLFHTLESTVPAPTGLTIDNVTASGAVASWTGSDEAQSYNLRYRTKVEGSGENISENFDSSSLLPTGWVGNNGVFVDTPPPGLMAISASNILGMEYNGYVSLPQGKLPMTLTFYAAAFGTATSSYIISVLIDGTEKTVAEGTANAGTFAKQTIDLSAYAGQTGNIVIKQTAGDFLIIDNVVCSGDEEIGQWQTVENVTNPYTMSNLISETSYEVQLQAVTTEGVSRWSSSQSFETLEGIKSPTDLAIDNVTASGAVASWTGSDEAQSYNLRYRAKDDSQAEWTVINGITAGTYTLTELEPETSYEVQVQATDGEVISPWSSKKAFTTLELFAKPTGLTAESVNATNALLAWTGSADAQSYNLRYSNVILSENFDGSSISTGWTSGGDSFVGRPMSTSAPSGSKVMALGENGGMATPVIPLGGILTFKAAAEMSSTAFYEVYVSSVGMVASGTVEIGKFAQQTVDLSAYAGQTGSIVIRKAGGAYLLIDDIEVETDTEWQTVENIEDTHYAISGLDPETKYNVQVQTVFADGTSKWSDQVKFTTLERFAQPYDLTASSVTYNSAALSWKGNDDVQMYLMRYRENNMPFNENFDSSDELPAGWEVNGSGSIENNENAPSGTGVLLLTDDCSVITNEIPLGGTLSFKTIGNYVSYAVSVELGGEQKMLVSDSAPSGTFEEKTIDLSAYTGQTGRLIFSCYSNLKKVLAAKAGSGAADAVVSSELYLDDIVLKLGDDVVVGDWISVDDVTSPYALSGLEPEKTYEVQVKAVYGEIETNWTNGLFFTTLDSYAQPFDMEVSNLSSDGAVVLWTGNDNVQQFNLRYRENNELLNENFDSSNELLAGWEVKGSGYIENNENAPSGTGVLVITDGSVMMTNEIPLGGTLSFKTSGRFASYAVSVELGGEQKMLVSDSAPNGTFEEKTIDLSAYAGQTGRLIFSCSNNLKEVLAAKATKVISATDAPFFVIDPKVYFDDIVLKLGDDAVVGDWISVDDVTSPYALGDLDPEKTYEVQVKAVYDEQETDWTKGVFFTTLLATGITDYHFATPAKNVDAWYDLSGRKLNARPAKAGMYIYRGKKIMVER